MLGNWEWKFHLDEYNVNGQRITIEVYEETTGWYTQFSLLGF